MARPAGGGGPVESIARRPRGTTGKSGGGIGRRNDPPDESGAVGEFDLDSESVVWVAQTTIPGMSSPVIAAGRGSGF